MKVLFWGSRNLTWKHLPGMRVLASHALLLHPPLLPDFIRRWTAPGEEAGTPPWAWLPESETVTLLNGDGPPGRTRGAVGADKLALLACMERWPEAQRRVRWFPPEPKEKPGGGMETWAEAAARRDVEMAAALPERAYCMHTDVDSSRGSIITARALTERRISWWYCRVSASGELLAVEQR